MDYSALKRNEILIHTTTQMNIGKHYAKWKEPDAKGHILYDSSYEGPRIGKFLEIEGRTEVTKGW